MEKTINNTIFRYYEDFWLSEVNFNGAQSTFEIYKDEINEKLLIKILAKIEANLLLDMEKKATEILKMLSIMFWGNDRNTEFKFAGFIIDEYVDYVHSDFRMCFHCFGQDNFSDFANWVVDIKDFKIVGCSRMQL